MFDITAVKAIDGYREKLAGLEKKIWANPEGPYREYKACEWSMDILREAGFAIESCVGGLPTAFKATFGSGCPVIGFLGEYDALLGLSQNVDTVFNPVEKGGWGHGCGHNLLGVAHIGAVLGIQKQMVEEGLPGTVIYFGCPAEEILTGKVFMAREGAFQGVDVAIAWHPGSLNSVGTGSHAGLNSFKLHFTGRTAHAGGDPYNGRSALDAVELTNIGIQYLREHVQDNVRMHYIILDGGAAPNIVPEKASAWYYVRASSRKDVDEVYNRMLKIAQGAAMMTETEFEVEFLGGCYPTLSNTVLAELIHKCMAETSQEEWTAQEIEFAKGLNATAARQRRDYLTGLGIPEDAQLHTGVLPIQTRNSTASTDVGDVSYIMPSIMFSTASFSLEVPGHSWQVAACSGSTIGEKGMIFATKAMALFGIKILKDPGIVKEAKAEFDKATGGDPYTCPIGPEVSVESVI